MKRLYTSLVFLFCVLTCATAYSQNVEKEKARHTIIKTNLLNLLAKGPSVSIEHFISKTYSIELTFMQGDVNNFLLTDHYDYHGFLVRGKKYFTPLNRGDIRPYAGIYAGQLTRNIYSKAWTDNTGYFGYPSRDFSGNSIRGGATGGGVWLWKNNFVADVQGSLGYGRYFTSNEPGTKGYLDMQIWLSVGYYF